MKKGIILLVALMGAISSVIAQEDKSKAVNNEVFVDDYDVIAQFPGGEKECFKFLSDNIKYPVECMKKGIQGRVIVSFTINTDGSIEEVKTMRSPDPALSKEAERVIAMMPKWKPAMHGDKAVRSRMSIPVNFRLDVNEPAKTDTIRNDSVVNETVFVIREINARFPGGKKECYKWLAANMKYPPICQEKGIQGRVFVSFVVNKDGSITDVKAISSPDPALAQEGERLVRSMPKWAPAMQGNKTVRSKLTIPIVFSLK